MEEKKSDKKNLLKKLRRQENANKTLFVYERENGFGMYEAGSEENFKSALKDITSSKTAMLVVIER